jgi:hypothetical protein
MIITTGGKAKSELRHRAKRVGERLGVQYVDRADRSIANMLETVEDGVIVVRKERFDFYQKGSEQPAFFHPNSSMFRIKRLMRGDEDPFVRVASLKKGMTVLDCTLGWASDSIVASYVVGNTGKVVGVEVGETIALLTELGLNAYSDSNRDLVEAMKRIRVEHSDHLQYLQRCEENSFDVVYFDPMFEETIVESDGIAPLKRFAVYETITSEVIAEAKRVARMKVVLKDHWQSNRFDRFGFDVEKRKTSLFHFGSIDVN